MKSRRNKDKLVQPMEKRGENDALTIGTVGGKLHLKPNLAPKISALHIEFRGEVAEIYDKQLINFNKLLNRNV